ncbi:hypothetical protein KC730_02035, partial [Candidatus Kaiserbacteria bacterium]|nr:hypothetical protein [Candidatus Kaiserbacteria bacterium]
VGFAQRVVATLVACSLVLWSIGVYSTAQAANLTLFSDTLSDSDLSVTSSHTIEFDLPAGSPGILAGDDIVITWDSQDDGAGGQDFGGIAAIVDNSDLTYQVNLGGPAAPNYVASDGNSLTIDGIVASAGDTVEIVVADGVITNPAVSGSFEIEVAIANVDNDLGRTRVAIVDNVTVTAIVDTSFDFTITGLATSSAVNGSVTTGSTSPVLIDFGKLVADTPEILAQELTVVTNSRNGFVVTVNTDGDLQSSNGAIIDNFDEGTDVSDTGTAWNSPAPDVNDETTWGHWGMTSTDGDLNSLGGYYTGEFGANDYIAASTTPRAVFHHDGPSDGLTQNIGTTTVGYQIEITSLQEAADDYTATLTYVATPTF